MLIITTLKHDFFKTWSAEMAYVLGYFAADGCMVENPRTGHYIEFTSIDRILLEHIQIATGSSHRIGVRERGGNCKTAYRLQIGSREWFEDLACLGFTQNKSKTLQFPGMPSEFLGHFVRGYFDGDGCVYFGQHWAKDRNKYRWIFTTRFTSGSLGFLKELQKRLREHGVKGGYIYAKQWSANELAFSWLDSLALYRLMYHTAGVAELFLPRKRQKMEQAIQVLKLEK
jgi:hypothetical protein